jgi:hypothetical protein
MQRAKGCGVGVKDQARTQTPIITIIIIIIILFNSLRAISVFPDPVGPLMRMLAGQISTLEDP